MVKKRNRTPAAPVAPVRRERGSSWLTRKAGTPSPQASAQPAAPAPGSAAWLTTPGTYTTRTKRRKADALVVPVAPPQLPQLGTAATAIPGLVPSPGTVLAPADIPVPAKRPGEATAAAAKIVRRLAWRHRWQLTPAAATLGTAVGAGISPVLTVLGLGAVAGAGYLTAAKGPDEIGGRVWLSRAERTIAGRWAAGAAVWAVGIGVANGNGIDWSGASVAVAVAALATLTATPTASWLKSRQIRTADIVESGETLSPAALQLVAAWPAAVSLGGPDGLAGSGIVDLTEPSPGTIVAVVQLRADVHAEEVATADTRRWLERALHMGVGTAKVELVRDHAGQIRLVLTPSRHLEKVSKTWPGPVLYDDGRIPIAIAPDGREVCIRAYADDGVRHLVLIGSSGSGKSNTYNVLLLPTVLARKSVLIYLDGKGGTSSPGLARAMDMVVRKPEGWGPAIRMIHRIAMSRQDRYGDMGLDTFDVHGADPIIDLVIDEGSTVGRSLSDGDDQKLVELSERGRSLGIRLKIGLQTPNADEFPGGIPVRNNLMGAASNVVGLRPGGSTAKGITLSATSADIDLLGLPEGGGWAAILAGGAVAADKARVLWVPKGAADAYLDGFEPRTLLGADAEAAGETYAKRTTGAAWFAGMQAAREGRTSVIPSAAPSSAPVETSTTDADQVDVEGSPAALDEYESPAAAVSRAASDLIGKLSKAKGAESRQKVLDALQNAGTDGTTRLELEEATEMSRAAVLRHVKDLVDAGQATRDKNNRIRLVVNEVAA